jgi:hypothetical protein
MEIYNKTVNDRKPHDWNPEPERYISATTRLSSRPEDVDVRTDCHKTQWHIKHNVREGARVIKAGTVANKFHRSRKGRTMQAALLCCRLATRPVHVAPVAGAHLEFVLAAQHWRHWRAQVCVRRVTVFCGVLSRWSAGHSTSRRLRRPPPAFAKIPPAAGWKNAPPVRSVRQGVRQTVTTQEAHAHTHRWALPFFSLFVLIFLPSLAPFYIFS